MIMSNADITPGEDFSTALANDYLTLGDFLTI